MRTTEPTSITQAEALEWKRGFSNYPATLWTLQYRFRGPGTGFNVAGVADGNGFVISVPTTSTDELATGDYQWQAWVTEIADSTNVLMIDEGVMNVRRGFTSGDIGTVELRSPAKQMLDSINSALSAFATSDVTAYEISTPAGTRRVTRSDKTQLLSMRKEYATIVENELARERARQGKPLMASIQMRVYDE